MAITGPEEFMESYRKMLSQWEAMANDFGAKVLQSPETNKAMHGLTNVNLHFQAQMKESMEKALHALHVPSRSDYEDLASRISAMEASLTRIETMVASLAGSKPASGADAAKPRRTRTPGAAK
jgi:hypothetical protein